MNFRPSRIARRLIMAFASVQLALVAAVPLAEAMSERAPGPVSIERQHSNDCVVVHRPSACLLCQHVATRAQTARGASLPAAARVIAVAPTFTRLPRSSHLPTLEPPSRAPPAPSV